MNKFILAAAAAAALSTSAFAQQESRPTLDRMYDNSRLPHQEEGSEGWFSSQEKAAAVGQGRSRVHDGVIYNPVSVTDTMTTDDRLVFDVSRTLANDPALNGAYLNVDARDGEVRVSGRVQDYDQASIVKRDAESVAGSGRVMTSLAPR